MDVNTDTDRNDARTRTVTWRDPLIGAEAARTMRGLDYLRAMLHGEIPPPPVMALLGLAVIEVDEGRAVFGFTPAEYHYNPIGAVHGGVASTLLDSAMGCAVHSALPAGIGYTTIALNVNFVRPLTRDTGFARCEGRTIHVGGRIATAEGRITDAAGKLYAHATCTCMIFRPGA